MKDFYKKNKVIFLIIEFFGTMIMSYAVNLNGNLSYVFFAVSVCGWESGGAHFNPAISLASFIADIQKISLFDNLKALVVTVIA